MRLGGFKGLPDSLKRGLKQRLKAFARKPSLNTPNLAKERKLSYLPCAIPPRPSIWTLARRDLGQFYV